MQGVGGPGDTESVGSDPRTNADKPTGYQRLGPSEPTLFGLLGGEPALHRQPPKLILLFHLNVS